MKKIFKVIPMLAIVATVLLNPIKHEQPKQEAFGKVVPYSQVDPGGGSAG
ncbi:hypothetical protein [Bacillus manliponensis]|nr:hypothetical protein [Bacillus manliponensis]